ncbi:MAG TPA: hypothetical protein VKX40_16965 [Aequorivita sp.]|jgi:hypothetical protein|nr:hypothetical protein [Aequorivita sp.]
MTDNQCKAKKGLAFFILSLLAVAGMGSEVLLAFFIEPLVYGKGLWDFSTREIISHWLVTCIILLIIILLLVKLAKKKLAFDIFSQRSAIGTKRWALCFGLLVVSIVMSTMLWNGLKVVKEFQNLGWLKFIFQYLYYLFETGLFVLIIIFAQEAGEIWFRNSNIPWGGIMVALTWGLAHIFSKDLSVGIFAFSEGLLYGSAYVASKKNLFIAFPVIFLMFVL